jgi:hypothetical protein
VCADRGVHRDFSGLTPAALAKRAALKPRRNDPVRYSTLLAIRTLGRRVLYLRDETKGLNAVLRPLIQTTAPACWASSVSATTLPPRSSSPLATTPNVSAPNQPGHTCAASRRCPRRPERPSATDSTGAATAKPAHTGGSDSRTGRRVRCPTNERTVDPTGTNYRGA